MPQADREDSFPEIVEITEILRSHGAPYQHITPWQGKQRHRSYRIDDARGHPWGWVKIEQQTSPFAGVAIEADVLMQMEHFKIAPVLVASGHLASGCAFIITRHVDGDLAGTLTASEFSSPVLQTLAVLHAAKVSFPCYAGEHLFSSKPNLPHILDEAYDDAGLLSPKFGYGLVSAPPGRTNSPIHGSLALDNIVITGNHAVLLDWEAARIGYPAFDLACLAGDLAEEGRSEEAQAWRAAIANCCGEYAPGVQDEIDMWLAIRSAHQTVSKATRQNSGY